MNGMNVHLSLVVLALAPACTTVPYCEVFECVAEDGDTAGSTNDDLAESGESSSSNSSTASTESDSLETSVGESSATVDSETSAMESESTTESACPTPATPAAMLALAPIKQLEFSWTAVTDADYYELDEQLQGGVYTTIDNDLMGEFASVTVGLHLRDHAMYRLRACNECECGAHDELSIDDVSSDLHEAIGYIKSVNTGGEDYFGHAVAISDDGSTLAIGAFGEDGQNDNLADAGAVYVYVRSGTTWTYQATLRSNDPDALDALGTSVALSADGDVLVVGASGDDGLGDNLAESGAVYVFSRTGQAWSIPTTLRASNAGAGDGFGSALTLSNDGMRIAVGAPGEDGGESGLGGNGLDNGALDAGAVYVFDFDASWTSTYIKATNTDAGDRFGAALSLSGDGSVLAVGAWSEDGSGNDPANDTTQGAGAAYVYLHGGAWTSEAYVKAEQPVVADDNFGLALALSDDASTLVVGAPQHDQGASGAGALYVFDRMNGEWPQQAKLLDPNFTSGDQLGSALAISGDGSVIAAGSPYEDGSGIGLADLVNNATIDGGAVLVFRRAGMIWSTPTYVKSTSVDQYDRFGFSAALAADGETLVVGARTEDGGGMGVGADPTSNTLDASGAAYVY